VCASSRARAAIDARAPHTASRAMPDKLVEAQKVRARAAVDARARRGRSRGARAAIAP